jgi:2-polyprenyl-3-methyl-5-hydroxy-6-metoxy-1,4-benzoquinol methylase
MHLKSRIAIAVHTYNHIDPEVYFNHITVIASWSKNNDIVFLGVNKAKAAQARNILVQKAIDMNCTHILFLDSDHIIDSSMLPCLLGNEGVSAVSGVVVKTSEPHEQVGFVDMDETGLSCGVDLPLDGNSYDVDACAFGCTLIDLEVFKEIEKPWFKDICVRGEDGKLYQRRSDMVFMYDLKQLGKTIRIDTRVQVGHQGTGEIFYPRTYQSNANFQVPVYKAAELYLQDSDFDTVADLGCGTGEKLALYIKPHGLKIIGFDQDAERLQRCNSLMPQDEWLQRDFVNEPLTDITPKTLVICADVLEHLEKPEVLLANIPAGTHCLFSTPDVDSLTAEIKVNPDHKQAWNKESFLQLLSDNQFEIIAFDTYQEAINYKGMIVICIKQ